MSNGLAKIIHNENIRQQKNNTYGEVWLNARNRAGQQSEVMPAKMRNVCQLSRLSFNFFR